MSNFSHRSFFVRSAASLILILQLATPFAALRAQEEFDYGYIISDSDLTDYASLNMSQIQSFLEAKASPLANYVEPVTSLRASQIIYSSAQDFQISPKFLLTLIQKEQSLIESAAPLPSQYDWATGYAVCDSCDVTDPSLQKFKGFYNQVYNAAKRIRTVYWADLQRQGLTTSGYGPGITKLVDGVPITPANQATAVLFTYTPHLKGNRLFGLVWQRYFARAYPDGTLLSVTGDKDVWMIENGLRRKFSNRSVYLSYYDDFDRVLTINQPELLKYLESKPVSFPNYAFLRVPRGTVYLVVGDELRGFASREALRKVGVNPEEIIPVQPEDLADYAEGQPITDQSVYPLGSLMQDSKTGGVFFVQDGLKHPIWSREIMQVNFPGRRLTRKNPEQLAEFATSTPVLFREGELVRSVNASTVYLISNHERRPFVSIEAFNALGFSLDNVVTTSDEALAIHQLGAPIGLSY